ncbi:hypothetical protein [Sandaracinus amylolyticus]|uniref:hypothetical protein n=1 Tax=Sandaracinus amylolyticus TaxID=927083 RepID=UPI001F2A4408|nr:hypothetical protein [Sandaracinus amylolyticus]UJR84187.1 Hypothetical protein I5071_62580 [Sandaracinus amylolyticus]
MRVTRSSIVAAVLTILALPQSARAACSFDDVARFVPGNTTMVVRVDLRALPDIPAPLELAEVLREQGASLDGIATERVRRITHLADVVYTVRVPRGQLVVVPLHGDPTAEDSDALAENPQAALRSVGACHVLLYSASSELLGDAATARATPPAWLSQARRFESSHPHWAAALLNDAARERIARLVSDVLAPSALADVVQVEAAYSHASRVGRARIVCSRPGASQMAAAVLRTLLSERFRPSIRPTPNTVEIEVQGVDAAQILDLLETWR